MYNILSILLISLLTACASPEQKVEKQAKIEEFRSTIPICTGPADCAAKWEAAQYFIIKTSPMNMQTVTNVLIQTYPSPKNSIRLAMSVTKEPLGNGKYRILVNAYCDNFMWPCEPGKLESALGFNNYVNSIQQ